MRWVWCKIQHEELRLTGDVSWKFERIVERSFHIYRDGSCRRLWRCLQLPFLFVSLGCRNSKLKLYLCTQVEITEMKKERETANKYRQQALEGDLMAMNNMGVCYVQGIGVLWRIMWWHFSGTWKLLKGDINCSIIEKIPPKGVSFSDFICTFAMSFRILFVFILQH